MKIWFTLQNEEGGGFIWNLSSLESLFQGK
jgi:hypothetical protein